MFEWNVSCSSIPEMGHLDTVYMTADVIEMAECSSARREIEAWVLLLKQIETFPLTNACQQVRMRHVSEMTEMIFKMDVPFHRCGMLKNPHCLMVLMSEEFNWIFAALRRLWWRHDMREKFSRVTKNKQIKCGALWWQTV